MIYIIADTTSSIPVPQAKALGIPYIPQIIVFGDTTYRDDTEIDSPTFLAKMQAASSLPKTAAPPPALYTPIFSELAIPGNTIIVITPSAELSGTFRSATIAAQDFPSADIRIIDSRVIASGLASIVLRAKEWVEQGLDPDSLEVKIRDLCQRNRTYFIVDTLEYLYKGGRIGGAQMLFGSILQVKPILMLKDGRTEPKESQRTKKRAYSRLIEIISEECPHDSESLIAIGQGNAQIDAQQLADQIKNALGVTQVPIYDMPPAILVHAGPGVICVSFFVK